MTLDEFITIFKDGFDELDSTIEATTRYKEIDEWTSMQALILIADLDDKKELFLSADDLKNNDTIAALFESVNSQK